MIYFYYVVTGFLRETMQNFAHCEKFCIAILAISHLRGRSRIPVAYTLGRVY